MKLWERIVKMYRGYTRSYRRKYESAYAKRGLLYFGAVDWLIGKAQWTDEGETERGSILTSLSALSQEWRLSRTQTRTVLNNLEKDDFITIEKLQNQGKASRKAGLKIVVNNYDVYQSEYTGVNSKANSKVNSKNSLQVIDNPNSLHHAKKSDLNSKLNSKVNSNQGARAFKEDFKELNNKYKENIINTLGSLNNIYNINNKQKYPTDISEVKKEAEKICYAMSDETAQAFIDHYSALGWRLQNGGVIVDWTKLLPRWKTSEEIKRNERNRKDFRASNKKVADHTEFKGTDEVNF